MDREQDATIVSRAKLWAAMHAQECTYFAPNDERLHEKVAEDPREYRPAPGRPYFHIRDTFTSMQEPDRESKFEVVYRWMYGREPNR